MARVFISYSRKDIEFARRLTAELKKSNLDFWIDWEGIPPTVDWWREIEKGIEETDIFLTLISPDSARSQICGREIDHAIKNGKRLIPLILRDIPPEDTPPQLRHLNYIFFRDSDDFDAGLKKLLTAIHTDYTWVQTQREMQVKALEWKRNDREKSLLLNGKELQDAEYQLARNSSKEPHPTDLTREYVFASRKAFDRQKRITGGIAIAAVIVLAALAIWGWGQAGAAKLAQGEAERRQVLAASNAETAQAASTLAVSNARKADDQAATAQSASTLASRNEATAIANANIAATEKARAVQNADLAGTAQAEANQNADLARTAQAESNQNANIAGTARVEAENALIQVQSVAGYRAQALAVSSRRVVDPSLATLLAIEAYKLAVNPPTMNRMLDLLPRELASSLFVIEGGASTASFTPPGTQLLAAYNSTGETKLWEVSSGSGKTIAIQIPGDMPYILALSPDGNTLAVGNPDGTITLWNVSDPSAPLQISSLPGKGRITALAFSTDGSRLASGSDDRSATLWDLKTGVSLGNFPTGHGGSISSLVLSPDGNTLASGSDDNDILLWDIIDPTTPRNTVKLSGNINAVTSLAFSPDGKWLASGSSAGLILLWDLRDEDTRQQFIWIPTANTGDPYSVGYNSDGNLLTVNLTSGGVTLWNLQKDFWIQHACSLVAGKKFSITDWNKYFPGEPYRDTCNPS